MFVCAITGKMSRHGDPRTGELAYISEVDKVISDTKAPEKPSKIVVESRERIYTKRFFNEETREIEVVEVGRGWEIVREITVSEEGLRLWNSWTPEQRDLWVRS